MLNDIPEQFRYSERDGQQIENSVFVFSKSPDTAWAHVNGAIWSPLELMIAGFPNKYAADSFIKKRLEEFLPPAQKTCPDRGRRTTQPQVITGDSFHWGYEECPICGALYESVFSKYIQHP